jgi:YD repeat-containing protein
MTDAEGVATRYEYDDTNRLTAVVENYRPGFASDSETNVRTEYSHDPNGSRLTILDANGHTTGFEYDPLSRMVEQRDALDNTTVYSYDLVGNRVSLTDAMGFETSFAYDELNRLISIDYPETDPDVQFTYDAVGNRIQMVDGVGTTTWAYDATQRPTAVIDPFGGTVGYV